MNAGDPGPNLCSVFRLNSESALGFFVISQTSAKYSIFVRSVVDLDSQLMFGLFIGEKGSEIILPKSENPCVGCQPRILHTEARFK